MLFDIIFSRHLIMVYNNILHKLLLLYFKYVIVIIFNIKHFNDIFYKNLLSNFTNNFLLCSIFMLYMIFSQKNLNEVAK